VCAKQAASPDFSHQLGQLAKFYLVMGFTPEEIQVVIDDPEARAQVQRKWHQVTNPPSVRLAKAIFADQLLPLVELHRFARTLKLDEYLSGLSGDLRQVLDLRLGLSRDHAMTTFETASELRITSSEVQGRHGAALADLRFHLEKYDHDAAQRVPVGRALEGALARRAGRDAPRTHTDSYDLGRGTPGP